MCVCESAYTYVLVKNSWIVGCVCLLFLSACSLAAFFLSFRFFHCLRSLSTSSLTLFFHRSLFSALRRSSSRSVPVLMLSIANSSFLRCFVGSFSMMSLCSSRGSVVSTLPRFVVFLALSVVIIFLWKYCFITLLPGVSTGRLRVCPSIVHLSSVIVTDMGTLSVVI